VASASTKRRRKKPAKREAEEEILEKGRWSGFTEQQRLEQEHRSEIENDMARMRCQQLIHGGCDAITPDASGGFPHWNVKAFKSA